MRTGKFLLITLFCLHYAVAQAQRAPDGCPKDCAPMPADPTEVAPAPAALDLRPPSPAPEPRGLHFSLSTARAVRTTGIVLTVTGLIATVAGAAAIGTYYNTYPSPISFAQMENVALGGMVGGAAAFGAGVGMWAFGDLEVKRAEGRSPELTPLMRQHRGRGLRTAGIVLTVLGSVLTLASLITLAVPPNCSNGDDLCGLGNIVVGGGLGGAASSFLGAGIPLLATGVSEIRAGNSGIILNGFGPRAMPNGGGVGISGRF